jgi:hypothetical protein
MGRPANPLGAGVVPVMAWHPEDGSPADPNAYRAGVAPKP